MSQETPSSKELSVDDLSQVAGGTTGAGLPTREKVAPAIKSAPPIIGDVVQK